jgi:hypothetical protein
VTVKLRNVSGAPLHLGSPEGRLVDSDEVIEVKGSLAKEQPDDAVVVGEGDAARAYPTGTWAVVTTSKENG